MPRQATLKLKFPRNNFSYYLDANGSWASLADAFQVHTASPYPLQSLPGVVSLELEASRGLLRVDYLSVSKSSSGHVVGQRLSFSHIKAEHLHRLLSTLEFLCSRDLFGLIDIKVVKAANLILPPKKRDLVSLLVLPNVEFEFSFLPQPLLLFHGDSPQKLNFSWTFHFLYPNNFSDAIAIHCLLKAENGGLRIPQYGSHEFKETVSFTSSSTLVSAVLEDLHYEAPAHYIGRDSILFSLQALLPEWLSPHKASSVVRNFSLYIDVASKKTAEFLPVKLVSSQVDRFCLQDSSGCPLSISLQISDSISSPPSGSFYGLHDEYSCFQVGWDGFNVSSRGSKCSSFSLSGAWNNGSCPASGCKLPYSGSLGFCLSYSSHWTLSACNVSSFFYGSAQRLCVAQGRCISEKSIVYSKATLLGLESRELNSSGASCASSVDLLSCRAESMLGVSLVSTQLAAFGLACRSCLAAIGNWKSSLSVQMVRMSPFRLLSRSLHHSHLLRLRSAVSASFRIRKMMPSLLSFQLELVL